jgi:hypothetical protein
MSLLSPDGLEHTPETIRAFTLVGEFMSHWALLENELNRGVHKLCRLSGLEAAVVTANMGVHDRIHTVRTMLALAHGDEEAIKANTKLLDKIGALSGHRNTVAHTPFIGRKDGVDFIVIKAKGKFSVPQSVWKPEDFRRRNIEMNDAGNQLREAVDVAANWRQAILSRNALANVPNIFATTPRTLPQVDPPGHSRLAQASLDAQPPKPIKSPQKPKAPRAKPRD